MTPSHRVELGHPVVPLIRPMHWLWLTAGFVGFRLAELGLFAVDFLQIAMGRSPRKRPGIPVPAGSPRPGWESRLNHPEVVGQLATVVAPFAPYGRVELGGIEFSALSFRGKPAVGDQVRIVRAGRYSLLVEPSPPSAAS